MSQEPSQRPTRRTRRSGASLGWSEKDIDQAAQVGPEDADAAVVSWNKYAPREARSLLDAVEEDDDASRKD